MADTFTPLKATAATSAGERHILWAGMRSMGMACQSIRDRRVRSRRRRQRVRKQIRNSGREGRCTLHMQKMHRFYNVKESLLILSCQYRKRRENIKNEQNILQKK